jgi:hypothetical protein
MSISQQNHWMIGDPESRRVANYREAAMQSGLPSPQCVDWIDLIQEGTDRLNLLPIGSRLRFDSFGQRVSAITSLILHGGGTEIPKFGEILSVNYQYFGLCRVLRAIGDWSTSRLDVELDQQPNEIEVMFDKWRTHQLIASHMELQSHRPHTILLPTDHNDFVEALLTWIPKSGGRVFVKPRYASSASGVCYFRICKNHHQLIAPIEMTRDTGRVRLFNSLHVRSYTNVRDIEDVFRVLAPQGMIAEVAVNKARVEGDRFDLRVVVINGQADHMVARQSSSPITNLHLGNARAPLSKVEDAVGFERVESCRQLALRVADCFPGSLYCGIDVLLPRSGLPLIGEVNAFGDFLPGLVAKGRSVYQAILQSNRSDRGVLQ